MKVRKRIRTRKKKKENKKKERGLKGVCLLSPRRLKNMFLLFLKKKKAERNRETIEAKKTQI